MIAKIRMLLDSCAAVCVGPSGVLTAEGVQMEESRCRIITADGSIVDVEGMLRFLWDDPENEEISVEDFMLLVQMVKGAQEWLLALPELSCGGFRAFLNEVHKKSFLVFPNGCAVVLKQEADNCWSLEINVYLRADGALRFGIAEGELYSLVQEPKFEKLRDVQRVGSTKVISGAIGAADCGENGQMFANVMNLDSNDHGDSYFWPCEDEYDISSQQKALVCRSACYMTTAGGVYVTETVLMPVLRRGVTSQ